MADRLVPQPTPVDTLPVPVLLDVRSINYLLLVLGERPYAECADVLQRLKAQGEQTIAQFNAEQQAKAEAAQKQAASPPAEPPAAPPAEPPAAPPAEPPAA